MAIDFFLKKKNIKKRLENDRHSKHLKPASNNNFQTRSNLILDCQQKLLKWHTVLMETPSSNSRCLCADNDN